MYRKTFVEIDCAKLENNIKKICETYNNYKYYFGVVKANAYSHGIEVIKYLIKGGVNYLAVSSLEEALKIREGEKEIPILVLEPINFEGLNDAAKNNITITIDNKDYFDRMVQENICLKFHMKIDSGMNRFGLKSKEDVNYIFSHANKNQYLEGIYTHLSAGSNNDPIYQKAIKKFKELTSDISLKTVDVVHLDRSLTLEQHEKIDFASGVRLGIIMYGFNQRGYHPSWKRKLFNKITFKKNVSIESKLQIDTVFTFKTQVIEIKEVDKNEIVGYGEMFDSKDNIKIAILPYGFADFLYVKKNYVSINGKLYKTIVIYMDVTAVIIDDNVHVGDEVEVFGKNISIRKAAELSGENVYKLLASVSTRVPRLYKYHDEEKEIKY